MARQRFKIGTFNLYNLVLPKTYYYGRNMYASEDYEKKVAWISDQLGWMDADLVGFQEIFHRAALQQVVDASGIYPQSTLVTGPERLEGPVVGLLSRFPVIESEYVTEFPAQARLDMDDMPIPLTTFSRPVLCAKVELPTGHQVLVFVVHLKSKNPMIREGADRHDPMERAIGKARSLIRRAAEVSTYVVDTGSPRLEAVAITDAATAMITLARSVS